MAVPKTVGEKFRRRSRRWGRKCAVVETACRKTSREGWPGVPVNVSAGFFKRDRAALSCRSWTLVAS